MMAHVSPKRDLYGRYLVWVQDECVAACGEYAIALILVDALNKDASSVLSVLKP